MSFFTALAFLTVIPVPRGRRLRAADVGRSAAFFPLVGVVLGLLLVGTDWLLSLALPVSLVNACLLIALLLLTGLLHLDGFIDTCDGLGRSRAPQEAWEAMRDSRVGSFGVAGAFCLLLLKYISLGNLAGVWRMGGLVLTPVLSRWAVVWPILAFPYAQPEGLGRAFKEHIDRKSLALATLLALVPAVVLFRVKGMALMLSVWLVAMAVAAFLSRRFAGLTGDAYGFIVEVTEVTALILLPLLHE